MSMSLIMTLLVALILLITFCVSSAITPIPGDNSHYVEGESRYIWMPDGDGVPNLVDLKALFLRQKPDPSGENNQYFLYTRNNPDNAQVIVHGNASTIRDSNYLAKRPLVVLVHGWKGNVHSKFNQLVRRAFLQVQDANVIIVDWSQHANEFYNYAVDAVPSVGESLGNFVAWLIGTAGGNWNNVHLVGFSLGAHVVSNAGRQVGGAPSRVTGLDPAGPLMYEGKSLALFNHSGQYVEVIHTDGGILSIFDNIAHADFYPNGGKGTQPGCSSIPIVESPCSHSRAYELFAATVKYNHLVGIACANLDQLENNQCDGTTLQMGNSNLTKRGSGIFVLNTDADYPY